MLGRAPAPAGNASSDTILGAPTPRVRLYTFSAPPHRTTRRPLRSETKRHRRKFQLGPLALASNLIWKSGGERRGVRGEKCGPGRGKAHAWPRNYPVRRDSGSYPKAVILIHEGIARIFCRQRLMKTPFCNCSLTTLTRSSSSSRIRAAYGCIRTHVYIFGLHADRRGFPQSRRRHRSWCKHAMQPLSSLGRRQGLQLERSSPVCMRGMWRPSKFAISKSAPSAVFAPLDRGLRMSLSRHACRLRNS